MWELTARCRWDTKKADHVIKQEQLTALDELCRNEFSSLQVQGKSES